MRGVLRRQAVGPARSARRGEAELAQPFEGVFEAPGADDPAIADAEDGDLVDLLEAAAGRPVSEPRAKVRGGAREAAHDLIALRDQLNDLHLDIGERRPEGSDPAA